MSNSLRVTDDESKAVQKTPNRVSLDSMESKIETVEYLHPSHTPHMTIAAVKLVNGFVLIGKSAPADPENFNPELGAKFAREDALRQMWPLEGYLLCDRLHADA